MLAASKSKLMYVMNVLLIKFISEWVLVNVGNFNLWNVTFFKIQDWKSISSVEHVSYTSMQIQDMTLCDNFKYHSYLQGLDKF
jgi:hypothetical protein